MYDKKVHQQQLDTIEAMAPGKYNCSGIYSISIGNKLIYIGKSLNIKTRIGFHILNIKDQTSRDYHSHKYDILREAIDKGFDIYFDLLYKAKEIDKELIEEEIGVKEGELIRKYSPPLNYQIPKSENFKQYTIQKTAKTISLEEIMADSK